MYPALLAVVPPLYLQAQNPGLATVDALVFSATLVLGVALVWAACYGLLRSTRRRPPDAAADWAALLAVLALGIFYGWPTASDWGHAFAGKHPYLAGTIAVLGPAALLAALWWGVPRNGVQRVAAILPPAGRYVAAVAFLLAAWSGAQIAAGRVRLVSIVHNSTLIRNLARPIPTTRAAATGPRRHG